ncbi:hypothetical protein [Streptomyces griseocarneus]|uniref:hypothetical protein n=1 Tax=Streptomyces griseocarneus TaxID=51201 RepID=UPI00167CF3D0|nr:hypothetical protein [Streptomyces griseocarneus]MBZ6476650.1 hypothetical protein [Streptomyces griseocarneus]GHG80136.1 hypothetical protein GCM10018779_61430 [Streptomyces griseocarneus]
MSTLDSITTGAQVGALLPLLTAIVQRPAWSAEVKKVVAVVLALVAGVVTVAASGGWAQFQHGTLTFATLTAVLAASQATYDLLWKPSKVAPVIESVTSPKPSGQAG